MKRIILSIIFISLPLLLSAQKRIFIPEDLHGMDLNESESKWSFARSSQTDNLIFFWEKGFGDDLQTPPPLEGKPMHFDLDNLKDRVESFYHYFRDTLKFILPGSNADRFKMMVMVNYSLDGTAYGGTYDDFIGALWVAPNRIQDRKLNCLAHELGHSFQLQIPADKTGDAWGGSGFYEMTSQWMLWQVNPDWVKDEQYHFDAFRKLTHKAYLHMENIYHSPYVIEWWSELRGKPSIAELYREGKKGEDPVMTYKRKYYLSQADFCDEMFRCYQHLVNFDFAHARKETRPYACTFSTLMDVCGKNAYVISNQYAPENYGFNAIKLSVPKVGSTVTIRFQGLMDGKGYHYVHPDKAGWRYGFVGITTDDTTIYGDIHRDIKGKVKFTVPKDQPLKALYFIVMGAPTEHWMNPISWGESSEPDAQWPYLLTIKGSTIIQ
jgi:hypothetical protein